MHNKAREIDKMIRTLVEASEPAGDADGQNG